jgi:hypothetical protein
LKNVRGISNASEPRIMTNHNINKTKQDIKLNLGRKPSIDGGKMDDETFKDVSNRIVLK